MKRRITAAISTGFMLRVGSYTVIRIHFTHPISPSLHRGADPRQPHSAVHRHRPHHPAHLHSTATAERRPQPLSLIQEKKLRRNRSWASWERRGEGKERGKKKTHLQQEYPESASRDSRRALVYQQRTLDQRAPEHPPQRARRAGICDAPKKTISPPGKHGDYFYQEGKLCVSVGGIHWNEPIEFLQ